MLYVVYFSKAVTKKQKNKKQCSNVAIKEKNIQLSVAMVCFLYFWCCQINKQILTLVRRDFVLKDYCNGGRRTIVMGFLDGSDGKESAAMQETWVQSMEWEDPTCWGASKSMPHNYEDSAVEPTGHNYWALITEACMPWSLFSTTREAVAMRSPWSHCN